jgi:uncharacterized damage-inducible protein DinB
MFTTDGLLKLRGWAQTSYLTLLDHVATMPWELLLKPLDGFGFPTLRGQLEHISGAEAFWVHVLLGKPWEHWPFDEVPSMEELRRSFDVSYELMRDCISSLGDAELAVPREMAFPGGGTGRFSPALVVHHVVTHSFHHKGQVVAMCRLLGYPAAETDLDANAGDE